MPEECLDVCFRLARIIRTDVKHEVCLRDQGVLSIKAIPTCYVAYRSSMIRIYQKARVVMSLSGDSETLGGSEPCGGSQLFGGSEL